MAMASSILVGCGSDKGVDYNFTADNQVEYTDAEIVINLDEVSGDQVIDLLQGATANGQPLNSSDSTIFIREFIFSTPNNTGFTTPQAKSTGTGQDASPFVVGEDPTKLVVNTDSFKEALRFCDNTDLKGATDADGNIIGDGIDDFPSSITYHVEFIVDNGFALPAGQKAVPRILTLTINAQSDPITGVEAANLDIASGGTQQIVAQLTPTYACDDKSVTYSIADTSIATVDSEGVVTGANQGDTEITITSSATGLSTVASITTGPGFSIDVVNQDLTELGAASGMKQVPTCTHIGLNVQPSIVNDELTGSYDYSWMSDNTNAAFSAQESDGSFGGFGRFENSLAVDETSNLTVSLASGYSGATAAEDVVEKTVAVTAVENLACNPGVSDHPAGFNTDFMLDKSGAGYKEAWVTLAPTQLSGSAIQLTSQGEDVTVAHQEVWNKQRNWYSANYGLGADSVGRQYKYSVWVKLNELPTTEIKLTQSILAWTYEGGPVGVPGFDLRRPKAGLISATLKPTTDWQLLELVDELSGTNVWTVPSEWNIVTDVHQFWEVTGLATGNSIILDESSIVRVQ